MNTEAGTDVNGGAVGEDLGPIVTALSSPEVLARLESAAKRGKMPGFKPGEGGLFVMDDFGAPFGARLIAERGGGGGGGEIRFRVVIRPLMPAVFALVLVLTVWPGVWLTDSMINTYWSGYAKYSEWWLGLPLTWWWYIPLTAPFVPWAMWSAWKKSVRTARAEGAELVGKIRRVLA